MKKLIFIFIFQVIALVGFSQTWVNPRIREIPEVSLWKAIITQTDGSWQQGLLYAVTDSTISIIAKTDVDTAWELLTLGKDSVESVKLIKKGVSLNSMIKGAKIGAVVLGGTALVVLGAVSVALNDPTFIYIGAIGAITYGISGAATGGLIGMLIPEKKTFILYQPDYFKYMAQLIKPYCRKNQLRMLE